MQKFRFGIKKGNGEATIPVSSDHQNGDWIASDIYEGELRLDVDTGLTQTRSGAKIVGCGSIPNEVVVCKIRVHQLGTAAPVVIPYYNPFNYVFFTIRDAAGLYRVTGFTNGVNNEDFLNTLNHYELRWSSNALLGGSTLDVYPSTSTAIVLRTYDNTGALGDNIITEFTSGSNAAWNVITISRYKV